VFLSHAKKNADYNLFVHWFYTVVKNVFEDISVLIDAIIIEQFPVDRKMNF